MTDRSDLVPDGSGFRRVSYTCRYGFVDWGHASPGRPEDPNSLAALHRQLTTERGLGRDAAAIDIRLNGHPAFLMTYGMAMGGRLFGAKLGVATTSHWIVRRGLSTRQREAVALGILRTATIEFETIQEKMGLSSGFSAEDLPSNVLGLLSLFRHMSTQHLRTILEEVDVAASTEVWDRHLGPGGRGAVKNREFRPRLFPCEACRGRDTSLPSLFADARHEEQGDLWVRSATRYVDQPLLNARLPLDADRTGAVRPRSRR
jgi:hypothetical protein